MNKLEYISALKAALAGLPPEVINDMISAYEMRFIEGASIGRSEEEICAGLDQPEVVAARLRQSAAAPAQHSAGQDNGSTHPANHAHAGSAAFAAQAKTKLPGSGPRLFFSWVGLSLFNCFMLFPAFMLVMLLFASYMSSFAFLVGGSALTAASMANVNMVTLDGAFKNMHSRHIKIEDEGEAVVIDTGKDGIHIGDGSDGKEAVHVTKDGVHIVDGKDSVHVSGSGVKVSSGGKVTDDIRLDLNKGERVPAFFSGIGLILGGILLFLLNLVVTKYSYIGLKRYAIFNYTILKNA
jgi:uncharacterized membrane protein